MMVAYHIVSHGIPPGLVWRGVKMVGRNDQLRVVYYVLRRKSVSQVHLVIFGFAFGLPGFCFFHALELVWTSAH